MVNMYEWIWSLKFEIWGFDQVVFWHTFYSESVSENMNIFKDISNFMIKHTFENKFSKTTPKIYGQTQDKMNWIFSFLTFNELSEMVEGFS